MSTRSSFRKDIKEDISTYEDDYNATCSFCDKKTKRQSMTDRVYCPNGHFLVFPDGKIQEKQPQSIGVNLIGAKIYRKTTTGEDEGRLCDRKGDSIDSKKG